ERSFPPRSSLCETVAVIQFSSGPKLLSFHSLSRSETAFVFACKAFLAETAKIGQLTLRILRAVCSRCFATAWTSCGSLKSACCTTKTIFFFHWWPIRRRRSHADAAQGFVTEKTKTIKSA